MSAQQVADIEKVSSITKIPGTALRIVAERRSVAPLNLFHIADADGEIIATAETRGDLVHLIDHAKGQAR